MAYKIHGSIDYYLQLEDETEELVNVHYEVTPGDPGVAYGDDFEYGHAPDPPEVEIEVYNQENELIEVDHNTANKIIDLCIEDAKHRNNPFDKYNDD